MEEELRVKDLEVARKGGNHISAIMNKLFLEKAIVKEIRKGWNIMILIERAGDLPNLVLNPMGVVTHLGITEDGTFEEKDRVTHDLSFLGAVSRESENSRVDETQLEPCMFSHVLLRITHYIVNLRRRYPYRRIWLRKKDFKSAFRRLHLNAILALRSATVVEIKKIQYIIISLRIPFGGSPCPSVFSALSDLITDLINDLLEDPNWDQNKIFSENQRYP